MSLFELRYIDQDNLVRSFRPRKTAATIGSDPGCDLRHPELAPQHCSIYLSQEGYFARDLGGGISVNDQPGSSFVRHNDVIALGGVLALRFVHVEATPAASPAAVRKSGARRHRAGLAALLAVFVPGAGQAYNGQPLKAFVVLLLAPLVLPWLLAIWHAHRVARRIVSDGGREGRGGMAWVLLHGWALLNLGLSVALGLTLAGVFP